LAVGGLAVPAQAYSQETVGKSGWAYVDSREPDTAFVNSAGDAPIGAANDTAGVKHRYRSYFTFDISRFEGSVIHLAEVYVQERSAADCSSAQPVQIWRTDPISASTTWNTRPRQRELLSTALAGGSADCPGYLVWDIRAALQKAANRGDETLTVEIRVPQNLEADLTHGRRLAPFPGLRAEWNSAPTVSRIGHEFPSWACGTKRKPTLVNAANQSLMVEGADTDQFDWSSGIFAAWPVGHEDQRVEKPGASYGSTLSKTEWEMAQYPHGTTVAWTAKVSDGHDESGWAKPCYMKVDSQAPAAPGVSSTAYPADGTPHGGTGVPGTFRFTASGSADVAGYYWGRFGEAYNYVPTPKPGAAVTLEYTPTSYVESLTVQSIDAAGNRSPATRYEFLVRSTTPDAQVTMGGVGLPSLVRIRSYVEGVTEFGVRVGDGAETRIPAGADGTAETSVTFTEPGFTKLQVSSYDGTTLVGASTQNVDVTDVPFVDSADFAFPDHDGVVDRPGSFTFRPGRTGVVAYEYAFNYDEFQRLDAAGDGVAVLQWTPTESGWTTLDVRSIGADGIVSEISQYQFNVLETKPYVSSSTYPDYAPSGGVGIGGEFNLGTGMPDVDVFLYHFDDDPEQTIDDESSHALVRFTPERSGVHTLSVRTRFLDGSLSPSRVYTFEVSDAPVVTSTDYPEGAFSGQPGQSGQFTFNPGRPDVAEYRYSLSDSGTQEVAAAGADGRATVSITPLGSGWTTLLVTSVDADGTASAQRRYDFSVRDPSVRVVSAYNEYTPRGGLGSEAPFGFYTEISEVTTYEYRLNDGPWLSIARAENSLTTDVLLTMDRNGENVFSVRGRDAEGTFTPQTDYPFLVGTAPRVTSETYPLGQWGGGIGVPGDFQFVAGNPGVVEFEYVIDSGEPATVAADGDGRATVTFTPTSSYHSMTVRGRTADDMLSDPTNYYFYVN